MAEDLATFRTRTPARRRRGWGRAFAIAVGVHLVLGVVAWRVGTRLGVWGAQNVKALATDEAAGRSKMPVIMQAMEAINGEPVRSPLAAYAEGEVFVEWHAVPHDRVGVDWSGEDAPLIGYVEAGGKVLPRARVKK